MKSIWIAFIFCCGALLPLQAGLNNRLGKLAGNPAYASLFTFVVGALVMEFYILTTKTAPNWASLKSAPLYLWLGGGVLGAIYVTATMLALPRLGMALTFSLVIAGQVFISVTLDHFNVLVAEPHRLSLGRVIGILLVLTGALIVKKY